MPMRAQHTMDRGSAGQINPLVCQRRDDPRRRGVGEARFVGHFEDPNPFGLAQRMWRGGADGVRALGGRSSAQPEVRHR